MNRKPFRLALVMCMLLILQLVTPAIGALAAEDGKFYSSYSSLDEVKEASLEVNQQIAEESIVLMKNQNGALPLEGVTSVSVFGKAASDPFYAGGGSGTAEGYYPDELYTSIYDSLEMAGYSVNPALRSFYDAAASEKALGSGSFSYSVSNGQVTFSGNRAQISEVDPEDFTGAVLDSYARYSDAAIIVFGRTGSEGGDKDIGRTKEAFLALDSGNSSSSGEASGESSDEAAATDTAADASGEASGDRLEILSNELDTNEAFAAAALRHGLELTWEEEQLVKHVAENFDKVIVILNTPNQMEMGWVEDGSLGDIDACLWVGHPGNNGFIAIGEVLNGSVNPSGRLVDIWQADMTKDPTYYNIHSNLQVANGTSDYVYTDADGVDHLVHAIEYEEGIYYGYRYYETAAVEGFINYDEAVVYPFGYGLSYTSFSQKMDIMQKKTDADGNVYYEFTVTVKNTGSVSGKEVVQIYYTAPYIRGGIEKAHVVLGAFDKTELLAPGQSETLTLTIYEQDMASYDYSDANGNGHTGYELDGGTYIFKLMKNSHDVLAQRSVTIGAQNFDTDRITGNTVENLFSSTTDASYNSLYVKYDENGNVLYDGQGGLTHDMVLMSRADFAGTFPTTPVVVTSGENANGKIGSEGTPVLNLTEETFNDLQLDAFTLGGTENEAQYAWYDYYTEWYAEENGDGQVWDQGVIGDTVIELSDMTGLDWDDPLWVTFLNQLSWEQLSDFITHSGYWSISLADSEGRRKGYGMESFDVPLVEGQDLGVPFTEQADGPVAIKRQNTGSGTLDDVGIQWTSTMNVSSTWNTDLAELRGIMVGEEALALELNGWYGVAINIHRSPWGGRNFEYFSEDPLLCGKIAAAEVVGLQSKGVMAFIKHYAVNHQDTDRGPALPGMSMPGSSDYGLVTFLDEQTLREVYTKSFQIAVEEGGAMGLMNSMNHIGLRGNTNNFNLMTALLREEWGFMGYTVTDIVPAEAGSPYADPETMVRIGADLPLNAGSNARVSGVWNDATNSVEIDGARNDVVWAAVRMSVKRAMYVNANSSAMRNNLDLSAFGANTTVNLTIGVASSASIAVDSSILGTEDVVYELTGDLPAGLSFDTFSGRFSGTPMENGSYNVTISMGADGGWIKQTSEFTVTVNNDVVEVGDLTAVVGTSVSGKVSAPVLEEDGSALSFSAEGLPAGVTMAEDGTISGVPTVAGVYDITITVNTVNTAASSNAFFNSTTTNQEYIIHDIFQVANADGTLPGAEEAAAPAAAAASAGTGAGAVVGIVLGIVAICLAGCAVYLSVRRKKTDA